MENNYFSRTLSLIRGNFVKNFLLLALILFSAVGMRGQVSVVGTTAGTTAVNYATLNAAFTAINAGTHKGDITVTVTGNTTEPATAVPLLKSSGTSSYMSILIRPSGGNFTINSASTPSASKGVIILQGADNVTIDGDDPATAGLQNLSFVVATNASTGTAAIQLASNSTLGADGADNVTVKNCIVTGGRSSATSTTVSYGIVMCNISAITTGAYSSINTKIENNVITRCFHGIYANGTSATYPNTGLQIINNTLGSATSANNIGSRGIYVSYTTGATGTGALIQGNDIRVGDYSTTGYTTSIAGIEINTSNYGIRVLGNNIHDIYQQNSGGYHALGIYVTGSTNNTLGYIQNNIIRDIVASNYTTSISTTGTNYGIYFSAGATNYNIDHNTVVLKIANTTGTTVNPISACVALTASGITLSSFRNNIIVNSVASQNAYGLYCNSTSNISGGSINNNNYFVPTGKIGYYNATAHSSLAAWKTATSKDANSINVNPPFVSSTDMHIDINNANAVSFDGTGATGLSVTTDFDGITRSATPDIGADEFTLPMVSAPTIASFSPSNLCFQGGQTVTINGSNFAQILSVKFNGVDATSFTVVNSSQITAVFPAGAVDGTITITNNGGTATSPTTFIALPTPTVGVSSNVTICSGQSTPLIATGGATYSWSPATGLSGTTGDTVTANPTTTTTYTVTGTSAAGCFSTATVTVTVNPAPPAITASASTTTPCLGTSVNLTTTSANISTSVSEGFETWPPTGWTFVNAGSGNSWASYSTAAGVRTGSKSMYYGYNSTYAADAWAFTPAQNLIAGVTYTISYWYKTESYTEKLKLTVGSQATKVGQTTTLLTQASLLNTTYTQATATFTPTTSGVYYFALNCYSAANQFNLYIDDFTISGSIPATYAWTSSPEGFTSTAQNPTGVTPMVPTTYTVVATVNGCSKTSSVTVTPNPLPTISVENATICKGGVGATLTASGAVTYTWSPATGLSATTGSSVTANPTVTTTYTIAGTDANGCVNTTTATVTVNNPPVITAQASNQIVLDGVDASFAIEATGTGITYQWQVSTNGTTWSNIEGATNATYTVVAASSADNGKQFQCVVSGTAPCTAVTSNAYTLTVGSVSITSHPSNQVVCSNAGATFAVSTTGEVTAYQWQVSTNGTTWTDIEGANTNTLVLSGISIANTGYKYKCLINGGIANGGINSDPATLTVFDAVVIGTQPTSQTVCSNAASVTFTSAATGSGVAYKWQVSTNGTTWSDITGATSASYTITSPGVGLNNNQYRVVVSGTSPCSAVTSDAATLTVNQIVAITTQPVAVTQCSTVATASFSVSATGTGLGYQWQYTTNGTTWNDYVGATSSTLTIDSPATYAGNSFRCVVSGTAPCTSLTSNAVVLNITPILGGTYTVGTGGNYPTIAAAVAAYNSTVCFSDNVVFSLTDATYDIGSTPITVNQNATIGSYTLTFKPATGVTPSISGAVASNGVFVIKANNVIIDGSNSVGGTTRNLTITNTSTTSPNIIRIASTGTTPIVNTVVKNALLINGSTAASGIIANDATTSANPGYFNGVTIQNNDIQNSFVGVYLNAAGASSAYGTNANVSSNKIDESGANKNRNGGIYIAGFNGVTVANNTLGNYAKTQAENDYGIWIGSYSSNATVTNNTITNLGMTSTSSYYAPMGIYVANGVAAANTVISGNTISDISSIYGGGTYAPTGIWLAGATSGVTIDSNRVSNIKNNYASYAYGAYGIRLGSSSTTANVVLKNNMVWDIATYAGTTTLSYNALGVYVSAGAGYKVYNNTVNLGTQLSSSGTVTTAAFAVGSSVSAAGALDVRNNIFVNTQTTSTSACYAIYSASANTVFSTIDYNNYWVAGTNEGYLTSARTDLAAIQTGFGGNVNSKTISPNFVSSADMHLNVGTNPTLDNLGTVLTDVATDIDGDTRSATPDMGADEFTTLTCASQTLVAGTATAPIASFCDTTTGTTVAASGYTIGVGTTYQWEMSTNGTTFTGIGTASAIYANLSTGTLSATTAYRLAVICDGGSAAYSNVITITKNTPAVTTVSPAVTMCVGESTVLTASGSGTYAWSPATGLSDTTGSTVTAQPAVTTTYTVIGTDANGCSTSATVTVTVNAYPSTVTITQGGASVCTNSVMALTATGGTIGGSGSATLGAGASTSTSAAVNPFYGGYGGVKTQFLIKASELIALGVQAGNINSLGIDITSPGSNLTSLAISVGNTTLTAMTTNIETGLTDVYSTASFVPVSGVNTFNFSTPFTWNGTSNIIVSFCWSNSNTSNTASTVKVDAAGFTSSNARYVDSVSAANVCAYTGSTTPSGWNGGPTTASSRPKFIFGYSTVTPTAITWSPTTELYTNAAATTAYTGGPATVVYVKPTVERVYTATAANGACTTSATTTVTPLTLPTVVASEDATICNGETTVLTVSGANTYVWSPATGLSATTGDSVTANPAVTTTYTVIGTGENGCQSSDTVIVTVNNPVVVTGQTPEAPVLPGQSKTITVTATGSITGYQWMVSEDSGVSFTNLENSDIYQGVTTNQLTISGITFEMSGLVYKCVVTGSLPCGNAESEGYTLKVNNVAVASHPANTSVCETTNASFTALGTSSDESLAISYQWEMNVGDGFVPISDGTDISGLTFDGVNAATLNISDITLANNGYQFRASINSFINTNAATLTVNNPVVITTAPVDQTVCVNSGTATFSVAATGDNLAYQWQMSTNGTSWSNVAGATATSLNVTNPTASMNGYQYRVVVSGAQSCSSVNSTAAILDVNNPTFTSQPIATSVLRGNVATFTVVASAATSYQWQFSVNGTTGWANVASLPTGVTYSGADTATLTVNTSATTATGGAKYYRCVINNNGCTATSNAALLTVNWYCTPAPTSVDGTGITNVTMGTINNTTSSETGNYGDYTAQSTSATQLSTVNFSITYATGYAYGTKIWIDFNNNGVFTDSGEQVYYGLSSSANPTTLSGSFNIPLTAPLGAHRMRIGGSDTDAGVDPCYASTWACFEDYTINIAPAPTCDGSPIAGTATSTNAYVCAGSSTNISVSGETSGVLGISYQWYASTNNVDFIPVASATTATLATTALTEGTYFFCSVTCATSGLSANSNTVFVDVLNPAITATTEATRCGTGTVTLVAEANAAATINWYAAATGGASLGTGSTFTTPTISTTTTFYAEAFRSGGVQNVGNQNTAEWSEANSYTTSSSDAGIVFTTTKPNVLIKKAYVYVTGTGTLTFTLRNAAGTSIATHTENVTNATSGTAVEVSLPSTFSAATAAAGYRLTMTKTGVTWYYFTGSYPYTSSAVNITSGWGWGATSSDVRGVHNIDFEAGCTSARTAVVATVGQKPTATISYATPFCSSATNANVTLTGTNEYQNGTFSGSEGLSIDSVTGTINVAATTPGTYTVTYTTLPTAYCEAQTATTTVVINQALTSVFAYDAASYCTSQGTITPIVTGTAGTFTSSPAGLSINSTTGAINLAASTAGTYTITNTVSVSGCANSVSTAVVTVNTAVEITSQPANSSVLPGADVSFTVTATGTGLTYQWQESTDNGLTWNDIEGTSATLTLNAVASSAQYHVIVSGLGSCQSVTSNAAVLTVNTAAITQHPANFTACSEGANTATFTVTTTGEVTGYQWQVNEGSGWSNIANGGIYADATSATLSLSGLALANNGWQFRCVVNEVVVSNPATLSINTAVAIATQPENTTVCSNGSATFTAAATGTGVAYQWQVSTNGTSWSNVSGATNATLTLNTITPAMNGYQYKVIVSGTSPCSPVTSNVATLTVNTAVAIATQPVGATVCIDGSATFTVAATGTGLAYQWEMSTNGSSWSAVADATSTSLTVSGAQLAMNGYKYRVVVSGATACSSVTSNVVTLVVDQPAAPVFTPASATICEGSVQTLSVASSSVVQSGIIGTGSVSNTGNTPFKGYWGGNKVQYLYTAAELQALGFANGTVITSLGMDITSFTSPYTFNNFTVGMKNTASSVLTTTFETGLTTVRNSSNYQLSGTAPFTVTLPLDSQFTWDGTSNLLIEFCFNNNNGGGVSTNSADVKSSSTTTNMTTYYSSDSTPTVCTNTSSTTSTTRANMRFGVNNGSLVWSPTTGLYTNAAATTPYTGGHATTVYAKPSTTTQYTVTVTNSRGCTNTASVNVNVLAPATLSSITQPVTTCSGAQTTFSLTGLLPNSTSTIGYSVNNGATQTVTNVVADASGNATFTIALAAFTNGQSLVVKSITRTDVTPNCTTTITANNSVTISVQPTVTYYADADNDGYGDLNTPMITCQGQPAGYVTNSTDCNDADATIHATVLYYVDADGDGYGSTSTAMLCSLTAPTGYATNNTDCDDANALVWQSASFYVDADADGYDNGSTTVCYGATIPSGYATTTNGSDCNDADSNVWQSAVLYVDLDGDGYNNGTATVCYGAAVPSGYATTTNGTDCNDANASVHTATMYYADTDNDGFGAAIGVSLCEATAPEGYVTNNTDCDDNNANIHSTVMYYVDADGDGYGSTTTAMLCSLTAPAGYATNNTDCDDTNASIHTGVTYFVDADGDGFGSNTTAVVCALTPPAGYSTNNKDCDDTNPNAWTSMNLFVDNDGDGYTNGSATVCYGNTIPTGYTLSSNGIDCDDTNASVWQSATFYADADADGYTTGPVTVCYGDTPPAGYLSTANGSDCDDANALVWQSASFYVDADADGYDNGSATVCYGATIPVGYATTTNGSDCNDSNADIHATVLYYVDADGDGYGSTTTAMLCSLTAPAGYATNNTDCDDANALVWQSASFYVDADADGYDNGSATVCYGATTPVGYATTTNGSDCNDSNAAIHATVLYYVDADGDGYGSTTTAMLCSLTAPAGYAINNTDCDDANAQVWRSASFYVDADADGYDNGSATVCYGATTPVGYATTTNGSDCNDSNAAIHATVLYYVDVDGDGYGSTTTAMLCSLTAPAGYATNNTDCDDANAQVWRSASFYVDADADGYNNGSATVCYGATTPVGYATTTNGVDCNDANAQVWRTGSFYVDADGDTYGTGTAVSVCYGSATPSGYSTNNTDCNDSNAQVWRTGSFYVDTDGDTYGTGTAVSVCYGSATPSGYATRAGDCNDANASVNPGATEICGNGIDDNCNGSIDEGCVVTTKIQDSQCGATLAALNTPIYVDVIPGATAYRYEVSGGGYGTPRIYTGLDGINYFNLTQVSGGATFETTYSVRVAYKLSGVWKAYGTACNVTTPTPTTKVQASQCGVTLAAVTTTVYADAVTGISAYRFEVTNGTTVRTFDTANGSTNSFKLTQLAGGATLGMSYSVRVAVKYPSGVWGPFGPACMVYTQSTKVQASQCGITLDTPNTMIYADAIASAEAYRFEVTNGTTVRTYETASSAINYFTLTQLTGSIPYSTSYSIRVATKYAGIWGDYGQSCTVSTGAALTKVQLSQCGSTLPTIASLIYADEVIGATTYRFEVSGGGYGTPRVYTANNNINYLNLTQLSGGALYGTTYSIRVGHKSGGVWSAYGASCNVTTPAVPESKVQAAQCGTTLAAISTTILADVAYGATAYRFEVTNGTTVRTFDTANGSTNSFKLTQLTGGAMYSTTYAIRVAVKYGSGVWGPYGTSCNVTTPGVTTNVFPSQCGVTLASITTQINAVAIADPLITAYRFEVTNGSTVRTFTTIDGATNYFKLTQLSGGATYSTTYAIRVAVKYNGIWQAYGASCNVTTPAVQTVKVVASQCGTLVQPSTVVMSETAPVTVTKYRFELTAGATVLTYENTVNSFRFKDVPGFQMGTTYGVRVAYQYNGVWYDYGQTCNLTLPSLITKVQASRCGTTVSTSTRIYADALAIVPTKYRFEFTSGATVLTYENTTNSFRFKDVVGYQMGTAYSVRVATLYNNVWYPYGESCVITTEGTAPTVRVEQEKEVAVSAPIFSVKGYPNPYNAYFVLSLETPSESKVGVRVFDMAGKLIEEKEVEPAMLENLPLGANWPLGVYNIIVTQDSQVKTIKMVKNE